MEADGAACFDVHLQSGGGYVPGAALLLIGADWLEIRGRHGDAERLQQTRLVSGLFIAAAAFALVLALFIRGAGATGLVIAAMLAGLGAGLFSRPFWIRTEESVSRFRLEDLHGLRVSEGTDERQPLSGGFLARAPRPYVEFAAPDEQVGLDVYRLYLASGDDMLAVSAGIKGAREAGE